MRFAIAVLITGALAGCSATGSTGPSFSGEQGTVAKVVSNLASNASSRQGSKICSQVLAPALVAKIEAGGHSCAKVIDNQIDNVDSFTLTTESVKINGAQAQVVAKTLSNGHNHLDVVSLVRLPGGAWRISGLY